MLGWSITITTKEDYNPKQRSKNVLASWETGLYGADWIRDLVKLEKAQLINYNGGYPNVYQLSVNELLTVLPKLGLNTPPSGPLVIGLDPKESYVTPRDWARIEIVDQAKLANLPKETELIVEIWDLS